MVRQFNFIFSFLVPFLFLLGCSTKSEIEKSVDGVFAEMDSISKPGCACSIAKNGDLIYSNGYGMANFEYEIPISSSSVFHVASVSKHFTAMAIELLVNDKIVSWDDDIRKYVPEVPDFGPTITLRHLVHHVSGIRDQWNLLYRAGWRWEADVVTQKDVLDITSRQTSLNFKPEERYLYSNTGFTLLAVVVERQTGLTLREFCEERIFKPLGMNNTHFHDDHEMIVPNRAWGYAPEEGGYLGYKISIPDFDVVGATSLFTTVKDMAKWDKNFYTMEVGGKEAFSRFYDKMVFKNGDTLNYMHGLDEGKFRGLRTVSHGGADAGYRSNFLRFPDQNLSVTVLCNFPSSNPGRLAREVAEIYLEEEMEQSVEEEQGSNDFTPLSDLNKLVGVYADTVSNNVYEIKLENDTLIFNAGPGYKLTQTGNYDFLLEGTTATLELIPQSMDDEGRARFLPDGDLHFKKDKWEPEDSDLSGFIGIFYSSELDTEYQFELVESSLTFKHRKMDSSILEPLFNNAFKLDGATLVFSDDKSSFMLSDGRVWHVKFKKVPVYQ